MQRSLTPELTWQDSFHQKKRQCKEHYPLCFSSKHLSNNQAGHHSQFAKQGETLQPYSPVFCPAQLEAACTEAALQKGQQ